MKQVIRSPRALGAAIARQRRLKKLNQTQAGQPLKLEQSTMSSIERGAPGTRLDTLFRVLAALDLEMIIQSKNISEHEDW